MAVNKGLFGGIDQFKLDTALAAQHVNIEVLKAGQELVAAVSLAARIEHGERAVTEKLI